MVERITSGRRPARSDWGRIMKARMVITVVATLLFVSSCGVSRTAVEGEAASDTTPPTVDSTADLATDEPDVSTTVEASTTTEPQIDDAQDLASEFLDRISDPDPRVVESALELAEAGSPAEAFVDYEVAVSRAFQDAGREDERSGTTVTETDDGFDVCDGTDSCNRYSGFTIEDGKIIDFPADGTRIEAGAVGGTGEPTGLPGSGSVTVLGYRADSTDAGAGISLAVELVQPRPDSTIHPDRTTYRSPGGSAASVSFQLEPPTDPAPGERIVLLMRVDGAEPGGNLSFEGYLVIAQSNFTIDVPVQP